MWNRFCLLELLIIALLSLANIFFKSRIKNWAYNLSSTIMILAFLWGSDVLIVNGIAFSRAFLTYKHIDEVVALTLLVSMAIQLVIILVIRSRILEVPIKTFIDIKRLPKHLLNGLGISIITLWFLYALNMFASNHEYNLLNLSKSDCNHFSMFTIVIITVIIAPIIEEIIFRGFLFLSIKRSIGTYSAIFISSFLWAIFHEKSAFIGHFISGLILSFIFVKTRSIVPPIMFHSAINAFMVLKWMFLSIF